MESHSSKYDDITSSIKQLTQFETTNSKVNLATTPASIWVGRQCEHLDNLTTYLVKKKKTETCCLGVEIKSTIPSVEAIDTRQR
jgi:hypothetical protein